MNEQAIPVLIIFLVIASVAAFMLYLAFTALNRRQADRAAEPVAGVACKQERTPT